jgi:hypothetical protein
MHLNQTWKVMHFMPSGPERPQRKFVSSSIWFIW